MTHHIFSIHSLVGYILTSIHLFVCFTIFLFCTRFDALPPHYNALYLMSSYSIFAVNVFNHFFVLLLVFFFSQAYNKFDFGPPLHALTLSTFFLLCFFSVLWFSVLRKYLIPLNTNAACLLSSSFNTNRFDRFICWIEHFFGTSEIVHVLLVYFFLFGVKN